MLTAILFPIAKGGFSLSPLEEDISDYRWNLGWWEATHIWDKWIYKGKTALKSDKSKTELDEVLTKFFSINYEIHDLVAKSRNSRAPLETSSTTPTDSSLASHIGSLRETQLDLKPIVEHYLEGIVSTILSSYGLESKLGFLWPPVDVDFSNPPYVLVVSPRDKIERQITVTLSPSMSSDNIDELERVLVANHDVSALITNIGGIATYPSIVPPSQGVRKSLRSLVHEWLHQYWFFHPLGSNYWENSNMTTLNETAANLAGGEIGDHIFSLLDKNEEGILRKHDRNPKDKSQFDFRHEMRHTRLIVEEMLSEGMIDQAETYMEDRRLIFQNEGLYIRKLNQAYFAFYGSYGDNPASISPINEEVAIYRESFTSVGDFIKEIGKFSTYEEFRQKAGFEH